MTEQNVISRPVLLRFMRQFVSVSVALRVLAMALLVLIILAALYEVDAGRQARIIDAERQISRLDMVFAEQTSRVMEAVDLLVEGAIEEVQEQQLDGAPMSDVEALLLRRMRGVRQVSALVAVDENLHTLVSTVPGGADVPADALRAVMKRYRSNPRATMLISPPFPVGGGRFNALLTRPLIGRDGSFAGFAAGSVSLSYFEDFYRVADLSENGAVNLHLHDGTLLARYPHVDSFIGTSYGNLPPFTQILSHEQAGTLVMDSPLDGSIRVVAIRALPAFPLAVMVSVEQHQLLSGWRRDSLILIAVSLLLSGAAAYLLLSLSRRSQQREQLLEEARAAHQAAERVKDRLMLQIAERERAELALQQAQRTDAIGQLTGGLAHDFNNLLTVILGNVEILQRRGSHDEATGVRLHAIRAAAQRGATLTSHLLAFARRQALLPRAVDLNRVIRDMQALLSSACDPLVGLRFDLAPDLWLAMVDQNQIEVAIVNLVINARDASPPGATVTIETRNRVRLRTASDDGPPAGDYVSITVRDTGPGIPADILPRVFEPFFTTKPSGTGSGLGLSQVFGTARQSGGDVAIDTNPESGTAVSIDLPRASATPTAAVSQPPLSRSSAVSILLVDDNEAAREVTLTMLHELGYDGRAVASAEDALVELERGAQVDVLLTDLVMPGMNGSQLAVLARRYRPDLRIGFITGYAEEVGDIMVHGSRLIGKPPWPADLRSLIESVLADQAVPDGA